MDRRPHRRRDPPADAGSGGAARRGAGGPAQGRPLRRRPALEHRDQRPEAPRSAELVQRHGRHDGVEAIRLSRCALVVGVGRLSARVKSSSLAPLYAAVFARPWLVWGAAVLVATLNVFLFAFDRPWTASDGLRNWGDWVLTGVGLVRRPDLLPPWLYSGSILNLGVIVGGTIAALHSREFAIRVPARAEFVKGGAGGLLMGIGAVLAFGCNIGGFFSATSALSLSGLCMMLGLAAGAVLGLRYLLWETERRPGWSSGTSRVYAGARTARSRQPLAGAAVLLLVLVAPFVYGRWGYVPQ